MKQFLLWLFCVIMGTLAVADPADGSRRTVRFIQDDAQDYMVSKVYVLKYAQSNDLTPFVTGIVKRYNMNSVVNCIAFGEQNQQILTVTCPVKIMPYVDDFIKKADRDIRIDGKIPGDIVKGTGITRAVYRPRYRSGQTLINLIVNALINVGPYGSVYGYDVNSNQIYWKDNSSNSDFVFQFLGWLDRPAPQIRIVTTIYEVRESTLSDIGLDYLAWKNGPGLDLFQVGFHALDLSSAGSAAIQTLSGPFGGFFFAPQFDASFLRILEQSGNAKITNSAELTVANSDSAGYEIFFNPQFQNIIKSDNDITGVTSSAAAALENVNQLYLNVTSPIASLHTGPEIDFALNNYTPGSNAKTPGTLFFSYNVQAAFSVDRNNYGAELVETGNFSGSVTIPLNTEKILVSWDKSQEVEQLTGVPFLSKIPILKYLFGTTTKSVEKTHVYMTVKAELLNTGVQSELAGKLQKLK